MPKLLKQEKEARASYVRYLGIDPGASGGIAWIDVSSSTGAIYHVDCVRMPSTEKETADVLSLASDYGESEFPVFAVIERVHAFKGQGVSACFTFGQRYGFLRGCLASVGIPYEDVLPQAWMKAVGFPLRKGEAKPARKMRLLDKAQQLFPYLPLWNEGNKGTKLAVADALLLAHYLSLRKRGG